MQRVTLSILRFVHGLHDGDVGVGLLDLKLTLPLALFSAVCPRVDNTTVTVGCGVAAAEVSLVNLVGASVGDTIPAVHARLCRTVHAVQGAGRARGTRIERRAAQVRVIPVHGRIPGRAAVHLRDRDAAQSFHVIKHDVELRTTLRSELPLHLLDAVTGFYADFRAVGAGELLGLTCRLERVGDFRVKAGDRRVPVAGCGRIARPRDVRVGDGLRLRDDALRQILARLLEEHVVHVRGGSLVVVFSEQPVVGVEVAGRGRVRVQAAVLLHIPCVNRLVRGRVHGLAVNGRHLVDTTGRGGDHGLDTVNALQF